MGENKYYCERYVLSDIVPESVVDVDTGASYPLCDEGIFETLCGLLNKLNHDLKELNSYCTACDDTLLTVQELTYKLLKYDFKDLETDADYCHFINSIDHKDLMFWIECFRAINKCDIMEMEKLKREIKE